MAEFYSGDDTQTKGQTKGQTERQTDHSVLETQGLKTPYLSTSQNIRMGEKSEEGKMTPG